MAKVRAGTLGKGSYIGPSGKSTLRPNLTGAQIISSDYSLSKLSYEEYQAELKKFNKDLSKTIKTIITTNKLYIAQIVKNRLYNLQVNAEEQKISMFPDAMRAAKAAQSRSTLKKGFGGGFKIVERVDLFDTGAFYTSLSADYIDGKIVITSNDYKKATLIKKYGENVFQLTTKEVNWINENIIDKEIQKILDAMEFRVDFKL